VTTFRRLTVDAAWNLLGNLLPLAAAGAALPFLIDRLGTARFGVLSLAWVLIGYFSLFDLGMGRALTKLVAERAGQQGSKTLSSLCSSGLAMIGTLGVLSALGVLAALPWLPQRLVASDLALHESELRMTLVWIAAGVPLSVLTAAMRGVLEGFQRFALLNAIRVPAGIALFAAPCLSAAFTPRVDVAVAAMVATRLVFLVAYALPAARMVTLQMSAVRREWVRPLLGFGGWLTVSNIVGPVIVYLDRFVIGSVVSAAAVGFYAAPFEVVSRLLLIPTALTAALFPALTKLQSQDVSAARRLQSKAQRLTIGASIAVVVIGLLAARPGLNVWLGAEFAEQSTVVMQILLVGFAFNAAAQIPFTALHALGHTRQTALLHLAELLPFVGLLLWMVGHWGLAGAALAWAMRALVDLIALQWMWAAAQRSGI
jgi:O-antigen/teichoic acid export membrane protein